MDNLQNKTQWFLKVGELAFPVSVTEMKSVLGVPKALVTPIYGKGQDWVVTTSLVEGERAIPVSQLLKCSKDVLKLWDDGKNPAELFQALRESILNTEGII